MGESMIIRKGGGSVPDPDLPSIPGYHVLETFTGDVNNDPIPGVMVNCQDGGKWYNYVTNEMGKCIFVVNSGQVSLSVSNKFSNGVIIAGYNSVNLSIATPIGLSNRLKASLNPFPINAKIMISAGKYVFATKTRVNVIVMGAGGGGGGYVSLGQAAGGDGGGGGGGQSTEIIPNTYYVYDAYIGAGGNGGSSLGQASHIGAYSSGSSGGSSSFLGISATGGSGGSQGGGSGGGPGGGGGGSWTHGDGRAGSGSGARGGSYPGTGGSGGSGGPNWTGGGDGGGGGKSTQVDSWNWWSNGSQGGSGQISMKIISYS